MKVFQLCMIVSLFFAAIACSPKEKDEKLHLDQNAKQVIFFSDEKDYQHEVAYYDALIELKEEFPDEMENLMVLNSSEEKEYYKDFDIRSGPALIVIYKDRIMFKINGKASKEQIIKPVASALSDEL